MKRRVFCIYRPVFYRTGKDLLMNAMMQIFKNDLDLDVYKVAWVPDPGFKSETYLGFPGDPRDDDIWITCDLPCCPKTRLAGTVILFNMSPLPFHPWLLSGDVSSNITSERYFRKVVHWTKRARTIDLVFDYNEQSTRFLLEHSIRAVFCLPGYHKSMEVDSKTEPLKEGVYFMNRRRPVNHRRNRISAACGAINIEYFGDGKSRKLRDRLCVTPGVHLNLNQEDFPFTFGVIRVIHLLLANRRFVLSEPSWWSPLKNGKDWVEVTEEELPKLSDYYMAHPEERDEIGRAGYDYCKRSLQLKDWLIYALGCSGVI